MGSIYLSVSARFIDQPGKLGVDSLVQSPTPATGDLGCRKRFRIFEEPHLEGILSSLPSLSQL
jgi:hypothetical protein